MKFIENKKKKNLFFNYYKKTPRIFLQAFYNYLANQKIFLLFPDLPKYCKLHLIHKMIFIKQ